MKTYYFNPRTHALGRIRLVLSARVSDENPESFAREYILHSLRVHGSIARPRGF